MGHCLKWGGLGAVLLASVEADLYNKRMSWSRAPIMLLSFKAGGAGLLAIFAVLALLLSPVREPAGAQEPVETSISYAAPS